MVHQIIYLKYNLRESNYPLSLLPQLKHWSKTNYDCTGNNMTSRHSIEHEHWYKWYRDQNWNETQNCKSRTSLISRQSFWRWWIFDEISRMIWKLFCPAGISTREKKKLRRKKLTQWLSFQSETRFELSFFDEPPFREKKWLVKIGLLPSSWAREVIQSMNQPPSC